MDEVIPGNVDAGVGVAASDRWRTLPAQVPVEEQSISVAVSVPEDPEGGRNPDNDWLLRGA